MGGDEVIRLWCAVTHSENIAPGDLLSHVDKSIKLKLKFNFNIISSDILWLLWFCAELLYFGGWTMSERLVQEQIKLFFSTDKQGGCFRHISD